MNEQDRSEQGSVPTVFVSYTHESADHQRWVTDFSSALANAGIQVILDKWELKLGTDLLRFMEQSIRERADRVLLICTPSYASKANGGIGGVGYERLVVTGELAENIDTNKFICVLRTGSKETAIPTFAKGRLFADFSNDDEFKSSLETLVRDIHDSPKSTHPPIGSNPYTSNEVAGFGYHETDTSSINSIEAAYAQAQTLIRVGDQLGIKQLLRSLRKNLMSRVSKWFDSVTFADEESWTESLHGLVDECGPIIVTAMVAADNKPNAVLIALTAMEDLLSEDVQSASKGKGDLVKNAPRLMALLIHYLVGAVVMSHRAPKETQLLLDHLFPTYYRHEKTQPLWTHSDLMACSQAYASNCISTWNFVASSYDRHDWVKTFFVNKNEYELAIRAYQLVASLRELIDFLDSDGTSESLSKGRVQTVIPAMFMIGPGNRAALRLDEVIRVAFPSYDILNSFRSTFTSKSTETLRSNWPLWLRLHAQFWTTSQRPFFVHDLDVPPLPSKGSESYE